MALEVDGKVTGIPYGVEGYGLVYNKDLVNPSEVTDLDSFTKTLEKFKTKILTVLLFLKRRISSLAISSIRRSLCKPILSTTSIS